MIKQINRETKSIKDEDEVNIKNMFHLKIWPKQKQDKILTQIYCKILRKQ